MEVILPSIMTVRESHDIALVLQHKVEGFDEVERAFVHGILSPPCKCQMTSIAPHHLLVGLKCA